MSAAGPVETLSVPPGPGVPSNQAPECHRQYTSDPDQFDNLEQLCFARNM